MSSENTVYIAIELSVSSWLVAARLPNTNKARLRRLEGGDTTALLKLIAELRWVASANLGRAVDVACCFEAGRDGVLAASIAAGAWDCRLLLEPTSILVNRRARRAKTDRLDAEGMLRVLATWLGGDRQVCSILRALSPQRHHLVSRIVQQPLRQRNNIFHTEPPFSRRLALKKFVQRLGGRGNAGIARQRKPDAHIRKRVACLILNQKAAPPRPCCARDGL